MATLAEVLRQAGYVTPQGQVVGPRTDLAQKLKSYVMNIPQNAAQNLANQRADIDAALTMGQGGIQIGDREAFARQMAEVPNLMGTFIGAGSKLWNPKAAFEAAKLEKMGVPAEEIWQRTHTGRGLDNQWRQEVSDAEMKFNQPEIDLFRRKKPIDEIVKPSQNKDAVFLYDLVHHPKLREAYPESADVTIFRGAKEQGGSSSPVEWDTLTLNALPARNTFEKQLDIADMEKTLLHEMQHQIQSHEGFAKGGDVADFKEIIPPKDVLARLHKLQEEFEKLKGGSPERIAKVNEYRKIADKYTPFGQYERLAGEAEARLTANRQRLTDAERLANYPFKEGRFGLDVPPDEVLIRQFGEPIISRKDFIKQQIENLKK